MVRRKFPLYATLSLVGIKKMPPGNNTVVPPGINTVNERIASGCFNQTFLSAPSLTSSWGEVSVFDVRVVSPGVLVGCLFRFERDTFVCTVYSGSVELRHVALISNPIEGKLENECSYRKHYKVFVQSGASCFGSFETLKSLSSL